MTCFLVCTLEDERKGISLLQLKNLNNIDFFYSVNSSLFRAWEGGILLLYYDKLITVISGGLKNLGAGVRPHVVYTCTPSTK